MDSLKQILDELIEKISQIVSTLNRRREEAQEKREDQEENSIGDQESESGGGNLWDNLGQKEKIAAAVSGVSLVLIIFSFFGGSNPPKPEQVPVSDTTQQTTVTEKAPNTNNIIPPGESLSDPTKTNEQGKAGQPGQGQTIPAQQVANSSNQKQADSTQKAATIKIAGSTFSNPFIDTSTLHNSAQAAIPGGVAVPPIPNNSVPIPSVGTVPIPNIPSAPEATPQVTTQKEVAKVKGIATDGNGKVIAIMSDGTVLSEGQSFADDRVAFIGGDGVTMDSGKQFEYNSEVTAPLPMDNKQLANQQTSRLSYPPDPTISN